MERIGAGGAAPRGVHHEHDLFVVNERHVVVDERHDVIVDELHVVDDQLLDIHR